MSQLINICPSLTEIAAGQKRNSCLVYFSPTSPNKIEPSNKFNIERSVCPVSKMLDSMSQLPVIKLGRTEIAV